MNEKPQKCTCMPNILSKPERTCWSLIPQLDTVVIEISLVKALNLRVNPQRLYRAKHLASQNGAYGDKEFYSGSTSYLNIKLHLLKMRIYWQSCNHIDQVTTKSLLLTWSTKLQLGHVGVNEMPVEFLNKVFLQWNWAYHSSNFIGIYPIYASIQVWNLRTGTSRTLAQVSTT